MSSIELYEKCFMHIIHVFRDYGEYCHHPAKIGLEVFAHVTVAFANRWKEANSEYVPHAADEF